MNQTCKVCGEPAAGFHFGAFTCEGCKSFFGRSYNNLSSISECKNNGECIINKKNRTACKACRLRKCLMVGMSKSGSRYGRRSNWFKIHCLLQEQQQQAAAAAAAHHGSHRGQKTPPPTQVTLNMLGHPGVYPGGVYPPRTKEEFMMLGMEDYKHPAASPSVSSPDSHNSDNSVDVNIRNNSLLRLGKPLELPPHLNKDLFLPLPFPGVGSLPVMPPPAFLPPSHLLFSGYHPALYSHHQSPMMVSPTISNNHNSSRYISKSDKDSDRISPNITNNNNHLTNGSTAAEELTKRFYLDAVLKNQRRSPATTTTTSTTTTPIFNAVITPNSESGNLPGRKCEVDDDTASENCEDLVVSMTPPRSPVPAVKASSQDNPIDLSMKVEGSTVSSKSSSAGSIDDHRQLSGNESDLLSEADDEETTTTATITSTIHKRPKSRPNVDGGCTDDEVGFNPREIKRIKMQIPTTPMDLTTRV